jgi:hypothetical protein
MDLVEWVRRQRAFSSKTFGPGDKTASIVAHIKKELDEILEAASREESLGEWVDVVILALDQCWRLGYEPEQVAAALRTKQLKNIGRRWPDWRTVPPGAAHEHDRSQE